MFFGEGNDTPLQYSCLENPMDEGPWGAAVRGVSKSRTRLSDFTFTFHFSALEKEMATHSSVLAWRIPGTGEPGGLPSMGSHRVGQDWSDLAAAAAAAMFLIVFLSQDYEKFCRLGTWRSWLVKCLLQIIEQLMVLIMFNQAVGTTGNDRDTEISKTWP